MARALVASSAAIVLVFGLIHLAYTFFGPRLHPRDPELKARMSEVSPVITRETTMWRTWVGFNATHSMGLILFGLVYGYLALARPGLLFGSVFLQVLGVSMLVGYVLLARAYFFRVPLRGVAVSLVLFLAGIAVAFMKLRRVL